MKYTSHSEYKPLKTVYIKLAAEAFISPSKLSNEWSPLNYLSEPDFGASIIEYLDFESLLSINSKCDVRYFPRENDLSIDSIYCRDASIATNYGVIICNMGKANRNGEPNAQKKVFENEAIHVLGAIEPPGTLEGGDVVWLDENTLAVGHTYRTNDEGILQLRSLIYPYNIDVLVVELPHYKGPGDVFHLMSVFSPVDKNLAVVYSPLMPVGFRNELIRRKYQLIEVPDDEFESMGCNVLAIAPRKCIMVNGNPKTHKALEEAGCEVFTYSGQEITVKGGGGPTCLTRPLKRWV